MLARAAPILAIAVSILLVRALDLGARGVKLVAAIPQALPRPALPALAPELLLALAPAALLISVVGFVESVSVGQTLAARRRERIAPDQELIGLGAANIAVGLTGGYPVTGGFARSVVNHDAGAQTPAAGIFTTLGIALAALFLTPFLADLPQAVLAATIILAVLSLVDLRAIARILTYSPRDFLAMAATILVTLLAGVEQGISAGVILSLVMQLYRSARPHSAMVGQVPGTEHFRNVERHAVITWPEILSLRVDESLYFANSRFLEDRIAALVADRPRLRHVVLMCPAVNDIDASALESLREINRRLAEGRIRLHLSEVKGPVMDRLRRSDFLDHLSGGVPEPARGDLRAARPPQSGGAEAFVKHRHDAAGGLAFDAIPDHLPRAPARDDPVAPKQRQMLRHRRVADAEEFGKLAHRFLARAERAQNHQPVLIAQGFQEFAGRAGRAPHGFGVNPAGLGKGSAHHFCISTRI